VKLRPYQLECVESAIEKLRNGSRATLCVLPTGTGKTLCFASVADRWKCGNVMVVAHREELIFQAVDKMKLVLGYAPEIEMGEYRAEASGSLFGTSRSKAIVSSVQTLNAGRSCDACAGSGKIDTGDIEPQPCPACVDGMVRRMQKFDPNEIGLLVVDESHHIVADSYRRIVNYLGRNPNLRVLGVTATPDRADEEALGKVFDSVAFEYGIVDAIDDGWLVNVEQQFVKCESLDLSRCRSVAGDLNGADLESALVEEEPLHQVVNPTIEIAGDRQTLVFAASVFHANRMAEIFNRHKPGSAECVDGKTPLWKRRDTLERYGREAFQYLINCGVLLEGYDCERIRVVAMARPTKSRALYAQCIGRGTRPLVPPTEETAEERRAAIAASSKPNVLVIDYAGNSGRHKLISTADVLGGRFEEHVIERAVSRAREKGGSADMRQEMVAVVRDDKRKKEEEERRAHIKANVTYTHQRIDPFNIFDLAPHREPGWHKGRKPSQAQLDTLERAGIPAKGISFSKASQLIGELVKRRQKGQCTFRQAKILARNGLPTNLSFKAAGEAITELASHGWAAPAGMRERFSSALVESGS
jgi:superfamily II DNA or RNA helicase